MKKRISKLEDKQPELSQKDKELKALFDRFQAADTEKKKYQVWKELSGVIEKYPGAPYSEPKGLSLPEWRKFVRYGWGHPDRLDELFNR